MDAVMKILKEIERQAAAEADRQNQERARAFEEEARSRKRAEPVAPVVETPPMPQSEPAAVSPVEEATPRWSRQRVLDALQLQMALGPPPGLEGW